ncbi:MAG: hypothetical protein FJ248_08040 [Nitrospira sp.]|nr:hypothetical protein [Nitrospira sp.]
MPKATHLPEIGSIKDLLGFLNEQLGWPIPEDALIDEITFDWTNNVLRLPTTAIQKLKGGIIRQLRSLTVSQPWGIFLVEFSEPQVYRTALRQILRSLVPSRRRDASLRSWHHDNLLFICTTADFERITFAHFCGDKANQAKLTTFGWRRGSSYLRTLLEHNLPKLAWPDDDGKNFNAWLVQWAKAFDKEPLTQDFFRRFETGIKAIKKDLEKYQKFSSAQAYSQSQLLLERLLFLYFLQNRGWLDQKRDYLLANFGSHRAKPKEFSFYADFLERVFFTLSTPPDYKGPGSGLRLEGIPFLNGGLFDDDEFAQTAERKQSDPALNIRNDTFAFIFDNLLEAFNFTVREDTPLNQDVAVDPEMLGKVFESIILHAEAADPDAIAPDKRKATGSYYTPRIVVHFICRETLCQYLLKRLPSDQDWNRRLRAAMDIFALDGLDLDEIARLKTLLSPDDGKMLVELVENLKCCDPAVGSGAFPVGLLHELLNFRRVIEAAANGYVDPVRKGGNQWIHNTKSQIVESCLYGADIQQQAIEICRLRLWLSLVVDYDLGCDPLIAARPQFLDAIRGISQLPNLEMNFRRGDSLLDMISGVPIRVDPGFVSAHHIDVTAIQKLGHDLHKAKHADRKKKIRLDILRHRLDFTQHVLEDERKQIYDQLTNQTLNLLGAFGFDENISEAENRRRIEKDINQLDEALKKLAADRKELEQLHSSSATSNFYPRLRRLEGADFNSPFNFVWQIDFADIFHSRVNIGSPNRNGHNASTRPERGGFDLVVGNPPFVTARNTVKRELYRARWARVCYGKYSLICPFFDLSFSLLRSGGELGFIVSNAFAKREFGKPLIEDFFTTVNLHKVVDCSGLLFPGHGTPTCIVFGANCRSDEKAPIRIAAILPGGGDLRTPPEESPLWFTLATQHDNPGYSGEQVVVSDRIRKEMAKWPWSFDVGATPTKNLMDSMSSSHLSEFLGGSVGYDAISAANDIYYLKPNVLRRLGISHAFSKPLLVGELLRNYEPDLSVYTLWPYTGTKTEPSLSPPVKDYLKSFRSFLEVRSQFKKTQLEAGLEWFEFREYHRRALKRQITYADISTHIHAVLSEGCRVFNQHAPVIELPTISRDEDWHLVSSILNSACVLFWLKQVCFNKGSGEDEHRDRFEFAGSKIEQIPVPPPIVKALHNKSHSLSERLSALARGCWERGQQLSTLALIKAFEKEGEAYYEWNAALPGRVMPAVEFTPPYTSTETLHVCIEAATIRRELLRCEMIAAQEEMDWLVYQAYGLLTENHPGITVQASSQYNYSDPMPLHEQERPFRLWAAAEENLQNALSLIPTGKYWPEERRKVWRARLLTIRDNEHIRRIEASVYKRRWDEQWKVGNRWTAGPAAYAQELVDAFSGWLAEKAEWYLERTAKGGPLGEDTWRIAIWNDSRVKAAWPVIADAINQVELHIIEQGDKKPAKMLEADPSSGAFAKYFRKVIAEESVPDGIPSAVPWEQLEKKMTVPQKVKNIRGKLNVPRERFHVRQDGSYIWAGKE